MRVDFLAELTKYWNVIINFTRRREGRLMGLYGSDKK